MKERLSATVILCLILFSGLGCKETSHPEKSYEKEAKDTERKNIARRLERINRENMTSYIYLVNYGKVMAYYVITGKPSSLNSYQRRLENKKRKRI